MAICRVCGNEVSIPSSCIKQTFSFQGDPVIYKSVAYGSEDEDWGARSGKNCHDCNCPPGAFHHLNCGVERCPRCGGQAIFCECDPGDPE